MAYQNYTIVAKLRNIIFLISKFADEILDIKRGFQSFSGKFKSNGQIQVAPKHFAPTNVSRGTSKIVLRIKTFYQYINLFELYNVLYLIY